MQQVTAIIVRLPGSAAGTTGQPGNLTAHMRSIARMAREAFGTGPGERGPLLCHTVSGAFSSIAPFVRRGHMFVNTRAIESYKRLM